MDFFGISQKRLFKGVLVELESSSHQNFVTSINTFYGISITYNPTVSGTGNIAAELITWLEQQTDTAISSKSSVEIIHDIYFSSLTNGASNLKKVINGITSGYNWDVIEAATNLFLPKIRAGLVISTQLEIPHSLLKPMKQINGQYEVETRTTFLN